MKNIDFIKERFCRAWGEKDLKREEKQFLNQYLISEAEFDQTWKKRMFSIFRKHLIFPEYIFTQEYEVITFGGGILFFEEEFSLLQRCLEKTSDKWLLVIEDSPLKHTNRLLLKFPYDIKWESLMSGGMLSFEIFERPIRNYFVFGDSQLWGKYVGSDYEKPQDVLGFKKEVAFIFSDYFSDFQNFG